MALSLTHTFVCGIADDAAAQAAGEILPSHWNAALSTSMATAKILGRATAGTGAIEELGTTGTGDVVLAAAPTITGHPTIEGVTATGATGTGKFVFDNGPTLVTPVLGVATATSINKVTLTTPATGSTLTINDGVTLTVSGNATISGTPPSLGANTFTALQTITQASANAGVLASTGYSLTGSDATGMVSLAGTLNTSGNPTVFKLATTVTAAGTSTKLFDVLGGASGTTSELAVGTNAGNMYVQIGGGACFGYFSSELRLYTDATLAAVGGVFRAGTLYAGATSAGIVAGSIKPSNQTGILHGAATAIQALNAVSGSETDFWPLEVKSIGFRLPSNGQRLDVKSLTELLTIAAAATSTTTIQKPAHSIILAVNVRVTVAVTCTSVFEVGDSGSANRFNTASVSKVVNSTDKGTKAGAYYNATAEGIVITPDTTPSDATGRVRVTIFYIESTAPTS